MINSSTLKLLAPLIDAHIHLDSYDEKSQTSDLLEGLTQPESEVEGIIAVSMHLASCMRNSELAEAYPALIHPAFGFHPEQPLPSPTEQDLLFRWMEEHADTMIAVGEVGLPYYSRCEAMQAGQPFDSLPYVELLERFIAFAKKHDKPIVLHAVYEDADIACRLLQQYKVTRAHFHWFKGSANTIAMMAERGYYVSFTPDIVYEPEIQELARIYPPNQVMAETDGPWPFEGPFAGQMTHPRMTADVALAWGRIQGITLDEARRMMYDNTKRFYCI